MIVTPTGLDAKILKKIIALFCASMLALQSIASFAAPCEMSAGEHDAMSQVAMTTQVDNNEHHEATVVSATDAPASNCCDGGYCSQSGCMSPSVLTSVAFTALASSTVPYKAVVAATAPDWPPSSLYRPPSA